jgi:L-asparaginase II
MGDGQRTGFVPIISVSRGEITESTHSGAAAVVDKNGKLIASIGNPNMAMFMRSTAKPMQALPFIQAGGHEKFGFTPKEIALICSSHSGTEDHFKTVADLQRKVGISEDLLQCGVHPPYDRASANLMIEKGSRPSQNHHNCSGKHTGKLAFAKLLDSDLDRYLEIDHPVQKEILKAIAEMCEVPEDEIVIGIDGCSAPVHALPLYNAALGLAKIADPSGLPPERAAACRIISSAMMEHPFMVAGPKRFDTDFMELVKGRMFVKSGSEGYMGIGILAADGKPGMGITIKISDGDAAGRARPAVALEIMRQLGVLSESDLGKIKNYGPQKNVENWRKLIVGQLTTTLKLNWH